MKDKKPENPPAYMTTCCECSKPVDTREFLDGGDPHGSELSDGRWVCSGECWDIVVEREDVLLAEREK